MTDILVPSRRKKEEEEQIHKKQTQPFKHKTQRTNPNNVKSKNEERMYHYSPLDPIPCWNIQKMQKKNKKHQDVLWHRGTHQRPFLKGQRRKSVSVVLMLPHCRSLLRCFDRAERLLMSLVTRVSLKKWARYNCILVHQLRKSALSLTFADLFQWHFSFLVTQSDVICHRGYKEHQLIMSCNW